MGELSLQLVGADQAGAEHHRATRMDLICRYPAAHEHARTGKRCLDRCEIGQLAQEGSGERAGVIERSHPHYAVREGLDLRRADQADQQFALAPCGLGLDALLQAVDCGGDFAFGLLRDQRPETEYIDKGDDRVAIGDDLGFRERILNSP